MTEVLPPILLGPTSKERKYDRQLRLWAANGQQALEDAHILLINSGPGVAGIETLKNLVLPGVGNFTILDSAVITEADLGVNFFLEEEDIGRSRAESCARLLQELNPDVQGHSIKEPVEDFITKPNALHPYTLILAVLPLDASILQTISQHSQETRVPVFYIHCTGFYSHFTLQLPNDFPIVDTHPDTVTTTDLRLLEPWPALLALVEEKTTNLEGLEDDEHGHLPYLLILLHYLNRWMSTHGGKPPQNYNEKTEFRELVRSGARTSAASGEEENFEEAVSAVLKNLNPAAPSSAVKEVFSAEECQNLTRNSPDFWIIAHAIRDFHQTHAVLPLSGSLPDMKAKSADYIRLQNVYKSKARADVAEVAAAVDSLTTSLGRTPVPHKEVESFCKCAGYVKLVRGRPPHFLRIDAKGVVQWGDRAKFAANSLSDPDSPILLYIAFLALDSFVASSSTIPKTPLSAPRITLTAHAIIDALVGESGISLSSDPSDPDSYTAIQSTTADYVSELVRAQGGELHNIAAVTGGMVAQEAIKVVTKQYVPVDNTVVFDGVRSKMGVVRL